MPLRAETRLRVRGFFSNATSIVRKDLERMRAESEKDIRWVRAQRRAGRAEIERLRSGLRWDVEAHERVLRQVKLNMRAV
jgi:Arc/MetJ-type ribon-helix-helix transcriptional regulator